jgi:hypothetical protein
MPSQIVDASKHRTPKGVKPGVERLAKPALVNSGASAAYSDTVGFCLACGPDHSLQIRELSRCGFRGEGYGAWCGSCRRVYALETEGLEPAA